MNSPNDDLTLAIRQTAAVLAASQRLVIFTGAGVSRESGIPTFRDAMDGLWAQYDPQQLATPMAFERDPKLVWDWYEYRRERVRASAPNPGHHALAALEKRIPHVTVITQNSDGLHQMAGSTDVIELHGNIHRSKCFANCQGSPTIVDTNSLDWDRAAGPPACPHCGAYLRPDVVWFHETLNERDLKRAFTLSAEAEVMLVIGTAGVVFPAARLPFTAHDFGATVIQINPQHNEITLIARWHLAGPSGALLPQILAAMPGAPPNAS